MRYYMGAIPVLLSAAALAGSAGTALESRFHIWDRVPRWLQIGDAAAIFEDQAAQSRDNYGLANATPKPCPVQTDKTLVAILLGQSNAANYAQRRTEATERHVSVFYNGQCYSARDPLLGATGARGSVWPTFAKRILASGQFDQVVLVPGAVGGTSMESWAPGGILHDRVASRLSALEKAHLRPTHILVMQGELEADSGEDGIDYEKSTVRFLKALKSTGAKVFLATTSRCRKPENIAIASAQESARLETNSIAGPDLNLIGPDHRVNGCHFDASAQNRIALEWAQIITSESAL